jgi:putative ABC transport system permease protein
VTGDGYVNGTFISHKETSVDVASNFVDYNYIDFAKIKILKGRNFSTQFTSDTITSVIINETCAKRLGIYNNPIGKKVDIGRIPEDDDRQMQVIGMIKDYHFDGFDSKIMPMFIIHWSTLPVAKQWIYGIQFKVKPENFETTINDIEEFWKENVDNQYPFQHIFLDQKFVDTYEVYQKQQRLFLIVSILVILISLLGLFALATLTIQQRLKEVAIRKTLGASEKEIVTQLVKGFLKITVVASIILIPIAYYFIQNWLENFVYRIDMPIWPFLITPIILLILVFSVVGIKAYLATKIDLIKYLKFE